MKYNCTSKRVQTYTKYCCCNFMADSSLSFMKFFIAHTGLWLGTLMWPSGVKVISSPIDLQITLLSIIFIGAYNWCNTMLTYPGPRWSLIQFPCFRSRTSSRSWQLTNRMWKRVMRANLIEEWIVNQNTWVSCIKLIKNLPCYSQLQMVEWSSRGKAWHVISHSQSADQTSQWWVVCVSHRKRWHGPVYNLWANQSKYIWWNSSIFCHRYMRKLTSANLKC